MASMRTGTAVVQGQTKVEHVLAIKQSRCVSMRQEINFEWLNEKEKRSLFAVAQQKDE
jgi:hypothetical protein